MSDVMQHGHDASPLIVRQNVQTIFFATIRSDNRLETWNIEYVQWCGVVCCVIAGLYV